MVDSETDKLREQLAVLTAEAANNELILRRAQARELRLLNAPTLDELLTRLVTGLQDSFGVPHVSLTLCDPDHEVRHLLGALGSSAEAHPGVSFVDAIDDTSTLYRGLREPRLGPAGPAHRALFGASDPLGSVALLPLLRESSRIGCLHLGSGDATRFTTGHATDILGHLGLIAAFALENAINRARLRHRGSTDVLTGWFNRRYLEQRLHEEVARSRRTRRPLAVLMVDLDHFKSVNDSHGHLAGDSVLSEVVQRIDGEIRTSDVGARYGGEEFVVLLPETTLAQALALAERIRAAVAATPIRIDRDNALTVTVSVGAAEIVPTPDADLADTAKALLDAADDALYAAKSAGRNRVAAASRM